MVLTFAVISSPCTPSTAGGAAHQEAVFVGQAQGYSVYLELGHVGDLLAGEAVSNALVECQDIVAGIAVVQAQHGSDVAHGGKLGGGMAADAPGGESGRRRWEVGLFQVP